MSEQLAIIPQSLPETLAANYPRILKGHEMALNELKDIQSTVVTNDIQRQELVERLGKVKLVVDKVRSLADPILTPLRQVEDQIMANIRDINYEGKDNEYTKAKGPIAIYDQKKLDAKKKAEAEAFITQQVISYKAELKAAVGRSIVDMMTAQKKNFTDGMSKWEMSITLENWEAMNTKIKGHKPGKLNFDNYSKCFHTNFNKKPILNDELTAEYIKSLEADFKYEVLDEEYQQFVSQIINEYRSKMDDVKVKLEEIKNAGAAKQKEMEEQRKKDLEAQAEKERKALDDQKKVQMDDVENQEQLGKLEGEFVKQGMTNDLEAGPEKRVASFENDSLWLKPFLEVVAIVATNKMGDIRNKKGEYIDSIDWWLKKFAPLKKDVSGIKIDDKAKTIIRA